MYHGTKWAVEGITESLRYELEPLGIHMKLVEPGAIATDFAGRSLDFNNNENLGEYQETIQKVVAGFETSSGNASSPSMVAEVIDKAIHGNELRYLAGEDAERMMQGRKAMNDNDFQALVKERFGL